ncbi:MAG TPA: hypothetical protein VMV77_12755 [Bacteroidales bacterium]|nr:hypothetical protein [archaeon]HUX57840.1 hypothetical protein [Bacteroidales bacterium]
MRKLTHKEYEHRLSESGLNLVPLEKYKGRFTKIRVMDQSGIEYFATPNKLFTWSRPSILSAVDKNLAFAIKSKRIHGDRYSYDFVEYIGDRFKVKILCPAHGMFEQLMCNHLAGNGCPVCGMDSGKRKWAKNGFSRTAWIDYCRTENKISKIYILSCSDRIENFIKIGITAQKMSERCRLIPYDYDIIFVSSGSPEFIYDKEKTLHKKYSYYKYVPLKKFDGYRECFKYDIFDDIIKNYHGTGVI